MPDTPQQHEAREPTRGPDTPDDHAPPTTRSARILRRIARPLVFGGSALIIALVILPNIPGAGGTGGSNASPFAGSAQERAERRAADAVRETVAHHPDLFEGWKLDVAATGPASGATPSLTIDALWLREPLPPRWPTRDDLALAFFPALEHAELRVRFQSELGPGRDYTLPQRD